MLSSRNKWISVALLSLSAAQIVHAQQPPDSVTSDANANTAMGTQALINFDGQGSSNTGAGTSALQNFCCGSGNTALGSAAGLGLTDGSNNTAIGAGAMEYALGPSGDNTVVGYLAFNSAGGAQNTAIGENALSQNNADNNTAVGYNAMLGTATNQDGVYNTGANNTAIGVASLQFDTNGYNNTAVGMTAMYENTTGYDNIAVGLQAVYQNTTGYGNSGVGVSALNHSTTANLNTAVGYDALYESTTGGSNTAVGANALYTNTTGIENTAFGGSVLYSNTTGQKNFGEGINALYSNTTGSLNSASGPGALYSNTTGSSNTALGSHSGGNLTTGSNNIDVGNVGVAAESGIIRIGTSGTQTAAYIAGIESSKVTGAAVYVTASGQLGVLASSERYKSKIRPMGTSADKLAQLRPVTFHLKNEPRGAIQYGLIAEEVATVYPELVIRDEAGRIQGVRYDELAPMLLDEVQRERKKAEQEHERVARLELAQEETRAQIATLMKQNEVMQAALAKYLAADSRVAMR